MTYVYKLYDASEQLLYVGIAERVLSRMKQHEATKRWWPEVARIDFSEYVTREAALDTERNHIRTLLPAYNVSDRPSDDEAWEILCDLEPTGALEDSVYYEDMHFHQARLDGGRFCSTSHRRFTERNIDRLLDDLSGHPSFASHRAREVIRARVLASLSLPCDPGCDCSMVAC